MIDLHHPLAVLAPAFECKNRQGEAAEISDFFGAMPVIVGGGASAADRPRIPIRLMASLLYLRHTFDQNGNQKQQAA